MTILISEYFECTAEANTFDVISGNDKLYTAEKFKYSNLDANTPAKKKNIKISAKIRLRRLKFLWVKMDKNSIIDNAKTEQKNTPQHILLRIKK